MARKHILNQDGTPNWDTIAGFKERLDGHDTAVASNTSSLASIMSEASTYSAKQTKAMSVLMNKMNQWQPWTVVCQGDSLTNGYDPVSADKRSYTADPTYSVGCSTDSTIASSTYPEVLSAAMAEAGQRATVIKRGYNGDTAQLSLARWTTNPNADLHIIQLGTNDTWLQADVTINIGYYIQLVKQILDFGSAVIISTPPKKRVPSMSQSAYVSVLKEIGRRFSIPVIETPLFHDGYYNEDIYQADGVHFIGAGYYTLGAKMASVLTGIRTMSDPLKLVSHRHLLMNQNYNHWTTRGGNINFTWDANSPFGNGSTGTGNAVAIGISSEASFGFYTDEDDLILIPQFAVTPDGQCRVEVNYRANSPYAASSLNDGAQVKPPNGISFAVGVGQVIDYLKLPLSSLLSNAVRITSRGYNSVQIKNTAASGTVYFYGFQVISYREYIAGVNTNQLQSTSTFPVVSKLPTYKTWGINRTGNNMVFAPSATTDATDWNWSNQFTFNGDTGILDAKVGLSENGVTLPNKYAPKMVGVPASATATGTTGQIAQDGSYLYICTATNTWKRVAITSW